MTQEKRKMDSEAAPSNSARSGRMTTPGSSTMRARTPVTGEGNRTLLDSNRSNVAQPSHNAQAPTEGEGRPAQSIETNPHRSPTRKRARITGDRYIPNRVDDIAAQFNLLDQPTTPRKKRHVSSDVDFQSMAAADETYRNVLQRQIFDDGIVAEPALSTPRGFPSIHGPALTPSTPTKNIFSFAQMVQPAGHVTPHSKSRTPNSRRGINMDPEAQIYSLSPIKKNSQQLLLTPAKPNRPISKVPYKVLDAPDLADDFYLNLVDWGKHNVLGVGLGNCVYTWTSETGRVQKLCEFNDDTITSVNWIQRGTHLAIGTTRGYVQIWDAQAQRRLRTMTGHTNRVGALAWNDHILTSGSRDRTIYHRDVRSPTQWITKLTAHKQEICGLKWNTDTQQLATGGNDNMLMVWDRLNDQPTYKFNSHRAAVKAIAWNPHQRGLLASGGGTQDKTIKFWDTLLSDQSSSALAASHRSSLPANLLNSIDTGSQVCNLAWSINSNELVSTHGFVQNQIVIWRYPTMQQVASLTGHTFRVLYLAMSPDGQVIVTGAGDETLRFWHAFKKRDTTTGLGSLENLSVIR